MSIAQDILSEVLTTTPKVLLRKALDLSVSTKKLDIGGQVWAFEDKSEILIKISSDHSCVKITLVE